MWRGGGYPKAATVSQGTHSSRAVSCVRGLPTMAVSRFDCALLGQACTSWVCERDDDITGGKEEWGGGLRRLDRSHRRAWGGGLRRLD